MKFKPVPPAPETFAFVSRAQAAVPLVPGAEDDCCARLLDRLDLPDRDAARTWLTFLRALELAEETSSGFRRTDTEATVAGCRAALLDRVFAAEAVHDALGGDPLTAAEAFATVRESVPAWERHANPSRWESVWRERVADLLSWLVLLDAAERVDGGDDPAYVRR
ncbi:hypothetical protein [Haloplanus halophilus]|uniref:hypothetical protein n=1 Tax=Haloplanus halophilus TaxID=2949993 RepID=UPI00204035C2|nr:hypothetical protein [Haloplanus sp. GDY1]